MTFHDGNDSDAAAVAWTFERIMEQEEQAFARPFCEVIEAVEPVAAHTVTFTLQDPTQTFLPTLAMHHEGFLIKPPATYKTWGRQETHRHPMGTDAFTLAKWEALGRSPDERH